MKAETLGASSLVIALRVALPQIMPQPDPGGAAVARPRMAFPDRGRGDRERLGLGYRIFLVRRYLAMDVILTYVIWITLLAFVMDWGLRACRAGSTLGGEGRA